MPAGPRESDANGDLHQQVARTLTAGANRRWPPGGRLDYIFTTTSQGADMAGDEPGVQHESTLAGAGRLPNECSKRSDIRKIHKHKWRRGNAPSIPNREDTTGEAAGRPSTPPGRSLVRGSPTRNIASLQSPPEPEQSGAPHPPRVAIPGHIDRFPVCWNRNSPYSLFVSNSVESFPTSFRPRR
jgi:hypothetical protein